MVHLESIPDTDGLACKTDGKFNAGQIMILDWLFSLHFRIIPLVLNKPLIQEVFYHSSGTKRPWEFWYISKSSVLVLIFFTMIYKQNRTVFWACKSLESLPAHWLWPQKSNYNFEPRAQNPKPIKCINIRNVSICYLPSQKITIY